MKTDMINGQNGQKGQNGHKNEKNGHELTFDKQNLIKRTKNGQTDIKRTNIRIEKAYQFSI